jgi:cytochrome c-type biogenesis protein
VSEYLQAFALGNAAILTNVCLLPLYPGLFVMLANTSATRATRWLGLVVLGGVVSFMIALGFVLHRVGSAVADILDWLLPLTYLVVLGLGVGMLMGRNPFERLATAEAPILRRPAASAYVYGMMLAPMTLPCTGPLIVSAFVIGSVGGDGALVEALLYFLAFALGFGWPLVLLPFFTVPFQRRATRTLAQYHRQIGLASGVMLVGIAVFGFWTEVRPTI